LSGALLARATAPRDAPPRSLPRRIAAGFFACTFPDIDFVVAFIGPVEYLMNHRGATHSILLLPLWAIVVAWVLAKILREPRGWRALYFVSALGIAAHIAGDVITSYGTMILAPLLRYAIDRARHRSPRAQSLWRTCCSRAGRKAKRSNLRRAMLLRWGAPMSRSARTRARCRLSTGRSMS